MAPRKKPNAPSDGMVLTPEEVARELKLSRNATYEALKRGEIPHVKIGKLIRIPRSSLQKLLGES